MNGGKIFTVSLVQPSFSKNLTCWLLHPPKCPLKRVVPLQYLNHIEVNSAHFSAVCAVDCLRLSCDPAAAAALTRPARQSASPSSFTAPTLLHPSLAPTPSAPLIIIAQRQMANGGGTQPYSVHRDVLAARSRGGSEALRCGLLLLLLLFPFPGSLPSWLFAFAYITPTSSPK